MDKADLYHGRLRFKPQAHYSTKVLTGKNWYEERLRYIPTEYKHCNTYISHFTEKGPYIVKPEEYWRNKIKSEKGKFRDITDEHVKNNLSTIYKINYDILPKTKGFAPRKYSRQVHTYVPQQNFIKEYGNMHYGLNEIRCYEIKDELSKYTWNSETHVDYQKPNLSSYTTKRKAVPRKFSSVLCKANLQNIHLPFRDLPVSVVPDVVPEFKPRSYPHFYF